MRQIATLPELDLARRLADYLLTLDIETRLEQGPGGWIVWVCDEDRVPRAREVLAEFVRAPADPRYSAATRDAAALRQKEEQAEAAYRRRHVQVRERWGEGRGGPRALTYVFVTLCVAVGLSTDLGRTPGQLIPELLISWPPRPGLPEVAAGQVWRLITPIFIHFGLVHILFNMIMLLDLGGRVEARIGSGRYLALVVVTAVVSNLAQYYLGPFNLKDLQHLFRPSPGFGGMSGVLYGLFGYAWMRGKYDPASGLGLSPGTVVILLVWLALGLFGAVERVANGAHAAGLLVGLIIGYAPHLWRRRPD
jgi:GlpG protein